VIRIGIEAQRLFRKKKHGLEIVALELIRHLQKVDKENEYIIFVRKDVDSGCIHETPNFRIRELKAISYVDWEQVQLPMALRQEKLDVLHCTANTAPLFANVPIVITLHDIIFLEEIRLRGNYYQNFGNIYRRLVVKQVVKSAKKVLTVSEWEKRHIASKLPAIAQKLEVVYNAVDQSFQKMEDDNLVSIREKYKLPAKFILFFGNTADKKNTRNTLIAYSIYASRTKDPLPLVLAGAFGDYLQQLITSMDFSNPVKEKIQIVGYIPFDLQPQLYNCASIFLYTSKRESFGLPIIEAMACGTPVVTSSTSSMPEVAGGAALLTDPENPDAIAEAINNIANNDAIRNGLTERGIARAAQFRWNNTAQQMVNVYKKVAQQ
jgi:glycosyltransferase involved in cell wall biosynthesis